MTLSPRQLECLRHAADGHTYAETATLLHVGRTTVKTTLHMAAEKLDARNTTHAVAIAYQHGLLEVVGDHNREQLAVLRSARELGCRIALVREDA